MDENKKKIKINQHFENVDGPNVTRDTVATLMIDMVPMYFTRIKDPSAHTGFI